MKQINFFYNNALAQYVINERGEFDSSGKEVSVFNDSIEALKFVVGKYQKRKTLLSCRIPDNDLEKVKNYLSNIESKIEID